VNFLYNRKQELSELNLFAEEEKAGFLYVRGRRRVGKSWMLVNWVGKRKDCIYFSGKKDATKQETLQQFIQAWSVKTASNKLIELRPEMLSWDRVFNELLEFQKQENKRLILVFDEIQWIAKDGSGFIGSLKAAWILFEMSRLVSVIVCGSSNKFFSDHVGGEEKMLRGIATRAPLWIEPIPLSQFRKYLFPKWNQIEIALTYMFLGGIPYYLQQINLKYGFVHAINEAIFAKESIFITEVDELLSLEFNKSGIKRVKEILTVIGIYGCSQAKIRKTLNLSSSTISEMCEKLVEFNILFQDQSKKYGKGVETRYYLRDFYLIFYFSIQNKYLKRISRNSQGKDLIFSEIINKNGYYIENFTGIAFENLVHYLLDTSEPESKLYKKLKLTDNDFIVSFLSDSNSQIDLVVKHSTDRLIRILECKWGKENSDEIEALCNKEYPLKPTEHRLNVIIKSQKPSKSYEKLCKEFEVVLITLDDLM
jgi:hypothetical protein